MTRRAVKKFAHVGKHWLLGSRCGSATPEEGFAINVELEIGTAGRRTSDFVQLIVTDVAPTTMSGFDVLPVLTKGHLVVAEYDVSAII